VLDLTGHPGATATDPFAVVSDDMAGLNANIKRILGVDHPVLSRVAKYFFDFDSGKKIRPAMVLLMGRAVNTHMAVVNEAVAAAASSPSSGGIAAGSDSSAASAGGGSRPAASSSSSSATSASSVVARSAEWSPAVHDPTVSYATDGMPEPLARALAERAARMAASTAVATSSSAGSPHSVSNSGGSDAATAAAAAEAVAAALAATSPQWAAAPLPPAAVFPLQARLAEVTEMIHTASLLHDDVIDVADTRRGLSSANSVFGNKLAVLAGDFLLARASVSLARLRSIPVVELLSTGACRCRAVVCAVVGGWAVDDEEWQTRAADGPFERDTHRHTSQCYLSPNPAALLSSTCSAVIEHLVKGEVMQMKSAATAGAAAATREAFEMYLRKT
jgi:geranylgeranyl pyrophosphate synthase